MNGFTARKLDKEPQEVLDFPCTPVKLITESIQGFVFLSTVLFWSKLIWAPVSIRNRFSLCLLTLQESFAYRRWFDFSRGIDTLVTVGSLGSCEIPTLPEKGSLDYDWYRDRPLFEGGAHEPNLRLVWSNDF